jgi:hypothetical protein
MGQGQLAGVEKEDQWERQGECRRHKQGGSQQTKQEHRQQPCEEFPMKRQVENQAAGNREPSRHAHLKMNLMLADQVESEWDR